MKRYAVLEKYKFLDLKKFAFLDAESARQCDPQIAALYFDQMVHHGKHHVQAICTCSAHLLDRVGVVLRENRPYELQDVDGTPISKEQARKIIAERYTVPDDVRRRSSKQKRREQVEQRAEKKQKEEKPHQLVFPGSTPQVSQVRGKP